MRVVVEEDVFRGDRGVEHHANLLALFQLGLARHTIEIEPARSALCSQWLNQESEQTRRLYDRVVNEGIKRRARSRRARTVRVADVGQPTWDGIPRLPLAQAIHILHRPLRILLENGRNDRNFLEIMTRLANLFDLRKLVDHHMIEIRTNGGIDENRVWVGQLGPDDHHGLWVMCDSDALCAWAWPDDGSAPVELGDGAKSLLEVCKARGVRIHILERRAIDNYLPLPVIERWSFVKGQDARTPLYQALAELSDQQRYHYNMKTGFSAKRDQTYVSRPESIYAGLDQGRLDVLQSGFDTRSFKIAWLFDVERLHTEFGTHISERWLLKDKQADEARRVAESILELL